MRDAVLGIEIIIGRDGRLAKATQSDENYWDIHDSERINLSSVSGYG